MAWLALGAASVLVACSTPDGATERPGSERGAAEEPAAAPRSALDAAIAEHWRAAGVEPTETADDAEFVRRVSLDLTGRIPTAEEARRFLADEDPTKRARLVDELLASDAWAEHWADTLTDTLVGAAVQDRRRLREDLHAWLEERLVAGDGWDALASAMLTADGEASGPGPAGFLVTHGRGNQVEALTGQTARVFLGLQVQCAQCHDDPDDRFTQREFYGLAAYYARTRARFTRVDGVRTPTIIDRRRGEMRMPTENDAPGDRSGDRVAPGFPGLPVPDDDALTRREALARGIVDSELFARAAVGHAWARLMGSGIVEPWDDLGDPERPEHPALLEVLAADFVAHDYDLRHLLRTITGSRAYQRSSRGEPDGARAREQAFAQAAVRPMTAPQLMRSLLVATGLQDVQGRAFRREVKRRKRQVHKEYLFLFDDDEMAAAGSFSGNVPQALLLLNGELTNQGVAAGGGTLERLLAEHASPNDRLDALYLQVYGRHPGLQRRAVLRTFLDQRDHDPDAYADLMHAMLVSSEFLTVH